MKEEDETERQEVEICTVHRPRYAQIYARSVSFGMLLKQHLGVLASTFAETPGHSVDSTSTAIRDG